MPDSTDFAEAVALLGAKVAAVRELRGLTQTELANSVGMQRKSVQNIEYGRASMKGADGTYGPGNPKLDTVFQLAGALRVDLAYLVDPSRPVHPIPA